VKSPPRLELVVELEELVVTRVVADSAEDESRLRAWLERQTVRRRIVDAVLDALEAAAEEAA
jgi:hypothetical protein